MTSRYILLLFLSSMLPVSSCVEEGIVPLDQMDVWIQYTSEDGLINDRVNTLFEDSQGNIWIGTSEGLSKYDGNAFVNYTTDDGLLNNNISSIAEDRDGDMWVGTSGGLNIFFDGEWYYFLAFEGIQITSLLETSDGNMLIGTVGFGAVEYNLSTNEISFFYIDFSCSSCNVINTMYYSANSGYWLGTDSGLKQIVNGSIKSYTASRGLSGNIVTALIEDKWNNIWVGTFDGRTISRITNYGAVAKIKLANSFSQNWVWDLATDNYGRLWVSTAFAGMYKYDGAVMRKDLKNLPDEYVSSLLMDSRGNLWIGTLFEGLIMHTPEIK